jgi:hypothetical protein
MEKKELMDRLGGLVDALLEAYKNEDMITVGDLAEYEIAPLLRSFSQT